MSLNILLKWGRLCAPSPYGACGKSQGAGGGLGGERGGGAGQRNDRAHPTTDEIGRQLPKAPVLALCPAQFKATVQPSS
jgi:hypothetical protein